MTSTYPLQDHKAAYFEYEVLFKIHGQPSVNNLLYIFCQLKLNTQWVSCTIGRGLLGYLGLILFPEAYSKIPKSEEVIHPQQHPRPFCLVVDSTNPASKWTKAQTIATENETDTANVFFTHADITQQKATQEEALQLYLEWQVVEQALQVQLIEAIDSIYLDVMRNSD